MQVKGLSPEMSIVIEADLLHNKGKQHHIHRKGERDVALSGSETVAWYQKGFDKNLGDPKRSRKVRVGSNNLKKAGRDEDVLEVGLPHSRGVIRVTPGESSLGHSKGVAVVRKVRRNINHSQKWRN